MDLNQLLSLKQFHVIERSVLLSVDDLTDKSDRTLIYGYDTERLTHHTYIKQGEIVSVTYSPSTAVVSKEVRSNDDYSPNKRIYPKQSDYEFCKLLKERGVHVSFATYDEKLLHLRSLIENDPFFGKTL